MTAPASIPAELRERRQWVVWRLEQRDGKQTKVPYRADGSGRASSTDPATWATFEAAVAGAETLQADGIGFVFSTDDPYVGVDLDSFDADDGAIVAALDSYTETSVSGRGAHVIVRASLNGYPRNRKRPLEVYGAGRYFVMTGNHMVGTPTDRQRQLEEVLARFLPAPVASAQPQQPAACTRSTTGICSTVRCAPATAPTSPGSGAATRPATRRTPRPTSRSADCSPSGPAATPTGSTACSAPPV